MFEIIESDLRGQVAKPKWTFRGEHIVAVQNASFWNGSFNEPAIKVHHVGGMIDVIRCSYDNFVAKWQEDLNGKA